MSKNITVFIIIIILTGTGCFHWLPKQPTASPSRVIIADFVCAETYVLKSKDGITRGYFTAFDGNPSFELNDKSGIPRIQMTITPQDVPFIFLFDNKRNPKLGLSLATGQPSITLFGLDEMFGSPIIIGNFSISKKGLPKLELQDNKGTVLWSAPLTIK